jgi:predicted transposase/invertase (TIGR01784 family)
MQIAGKEGLDMNTESGHKVMIAKAYDAFQKFLQDENLCKMARERARYLEELNQMSSSAEQYGLEKGRKEGMELARLEDARKFKSLGVSNEIILQATGLSIETVDEL